MQIKHEVSRRETSTMNSSEIRENFLVEKLFEANQINLVYTHYDRVIAGGVMPSTESVILPTYNALKADYFLERREIGIINVSDGDGEVIADNQTFTVRKLDCVYLGKGTKNVEFRSLNSENPARFFVLSAPAHKDYPNKLMTRENASPVDLGTVETANQRTIYKYIHLDGLRSCQLVMGLTVLKTGSVWNTMPSHVHDRRMEVYCYFDVPQNHAVCHLMGEPTDTKHIWVHNHQAIISPPWSIHSGCGTSNYSFIWGMAGENQVFTDMDAVAIDELR
jgi:4-deoxy-L-threo-5-hexosulose-uronate ketol-isomerase